MYFSRSIIPYIRGKKYTEWLPSHTFYKHIGLYAYRAQVLKEITQLPQSALELAESLEQLRWLENGYKGRHHRARNDRYRYTGGHGESLSLPCEPLITYTIIQ